MKKTEILAKIAEIENFTSFDGPEMHEILDAIKEANSAVFLGYCLRMAQQNGRAQAWNTMRKLAETGVKNANAVIDLSKTF